MGKRVVSVGDLVLDIILPVALPVQPDAHQTAESRHVEPGGAGNFMIAAQRMGVDVVAAGTVGGDAFGAQILNLLQREGVDMNCVVVIPGATSTLVIALADQQTGAHAFIGDFGRGPAVPYPNGLDKQIARADAMFLQGYTLFEERMIPMTQRALDTARRSHIPVYFDVGPFIAQVSPDDLLRAVGVASVILMTEAEVSLISGGRTGDAAYGRLLAQGPRALIIKQGAEGCLLVTASGAEHVPGFAVDVVDTIGAGDCFNAAFVAGQLRGLTLRESARLANAMGAAAVQRVGAGTNAPTCDEVMAILSAAGEDIRFKC